MNTFTVQTWDWYQSSHVTRRQYHLGLRDVEFERSGHLGGREGLMKGSAALHYGSCAIQCVELDPHTEDFKLGYLSRSCCFHFNHYFVSLLSLPALRRNDLLYKIQSIQHLFLKPCMPLLLWEESIEGMNPVLVCKVAVAVACSCSCSWKKVYLHFFAAVRLRSQISWWLQHLLKIKVWDKYLLHSSQWSQFVDVMVFISQTWRGGPAEAFITGLGTKTAFRGGSQRNRL